MAKFLLALAVVLGMQGQAIEPPAPLPLPSRALISVVVAPRAYDTSYLTLSKKLQLWQIFRPEIAHEFFIADKKALAAAWNNGTLVSIPDIAEKIGITVRTAGRFPIAEKEQKTSDKPLYWGLRKPAVGLLIETAEYLNSAGCHAELTSLVRSWQYQLLLMKRNPTANVLKMNVPPTHVFGLAFDITRVGMSGYCQGLLERYLQEQTSEGIAIYFKESNPQAAFHVIALPQAHAELSARYELFAAEHPIAAGSK